MGGNLNKEGSEDGEGVGIPGSFLSLAALAALFVSKKEHFLGPWGDANKESGEDGEG